VLVGVKSPTLPLLISIPLYMSQQRSATRYQRGPAVSKKSWALAAHGSRQSLGRAKYLWRTSDPDQGLLSLTHTRALTAACVYQTSQTCDFFSPSPRPPSSIVLSNVRRSGIAATCLAEILSAVRSRLLGTPVNVSQTQRHGQSAVILQS
jgi:hypothetical protein